MTELSRSVVEQGILNMTELAPTISDDIGLPGNEVYDMNVALLSSLSELESKNEHFIRRERLWRRIGVGGAIGPLVVAGAWMATSRGHRMDLDNKIIVDFTAGWSSFFLGMGSWLRSQKIRENGQQLAESALPVSQTVNGTTQPWIQHRLNQKEEDLRKQKGKELYK
jgi:hypothetical protein